jgi:hypothetical protein
MYDMTVIPVTFATAEKKNILLNLKELVDSNVIAVDLDRHQGLILALRTASATDVIFNKVARHGTKRVAKVVLIAAVPPIMLKSATNPEGLPMEAFDGMRSGLTKDRSQFYKDHAILFYGADRQGSRSPRVSWISSGSGACRLASRTLMKASRPSPRPISPRTSRS